MTFTETDKLKTLAIIRIFETSRPFGDYAACVVLNDGAGVSYGICQFTHRSGSLAAVVEKYLANGGSSGAATLAASVAALKDTSPPSLRQIAANHLFRNALRAAAATREMREAQQAIAFERYLAPAIALCVKCRFVEPLSLAVLCDSLVHGSFYRVARGVQADLRDERAWITAYVRRRHLWLASFPRLKMTRYRTRFFLDQIAISNWDLKLPVMVHDVRLMPEMVTSPDDRAAGATIPQTPDVPGPLTFDRVRKAASQTAENLDRFETAAEEIASRADSAKSLWTAIFGTLWQAAWAAFGWLAGLPREIWITAAVIAALLALLYLYRQIEMGKIREAAVKTREET